MFEVDVQIPVSTKNLDIPSKDYLPAREVIDEMEEDLDLERYHESSGCGFGYADVQFHFDDRASAEAVGTKIRGYLSKKGYTVGEEEGQTQVLVFDDDEFCDEDGNCSDDERVRRMLGIM